MSRRDRFAHTAPRRDGWRRAAWIQRAAIAALAATIASCGGSSPADSTPATSGGQPPATGARTADACKLLTQGEIAAAVGNPVAPGRPEAGPEVCDWDTEHADQIDVLLTVRLRGSAREQVLCADVRKAAAEEKGLSGIGDAATWKFTKLGVLDSGDLEVCDSKGYVSHQFERQG